MSLDKLRVDNVGSMLRPQALREAFAALEEGSLTEEELGQRQDDAIRALIARQEAIGFPVVVDGEFRRTNYMESFAEVAGTDDWVGRRVPKALRRPQPVAAGTEHAGDPAHTSSFRTPAHVKLRLERNRPLEEYVFAAEQASVPAKVTLIGPDRVASLHADDHPDDAYGDPDAFMADLVAVQREMVGQLVDAGCRYVQIDEPGFTAYVDEASLALLRDRGEDPARNLQRSIDASNALIAGFGEDVVLGVHLCRGNFESRWHREGPYDAIAEQLFGGLRYDRLMLEYDSDRAGGFEPLRFVRDDAVVVLGLLTTKSGELEDADELKRRIEDASAQVPVERLALSTQCGFASSIEGNKIGEDDQWRKLELILEVAEDVWGGAAG